MRTLGPIFGTSALALALLAPAAFADVSAADVWAQWQDYVSRTGGQITATPQQSGDTLTLTNGTLTSSRADTDFEMTFDQVTLRENGDGTVTITGPDTTPMKLTLHPEDGRPPIHVEMTLHQSGLIGTASGTPGALNYDFSCDKADVSIDSIRSESETGGSATGTLQVTALHGNYHFGDGEPQPIETTFSAGSASLNLQVTAPEGQNGHMKLDLAAQDLTGSSSGTMPEGVDFEQFGKALADGFAVSGTFGFGHTSLAVDFQDEAESFALQGTMAGSNLGIDLSAKGVDYETSGRDLAVSINSSQMPMPQLNFKLAESGFGITMPLVKSDTPQPIGLLLRLVGLDIDQALWSMIDSGGQIPHDPVTLALDLKGTANWLVDVTGPDAEAQLESGGMPGELHSLDLRELELTAAGASLTGTGAFTFDNSDLTTWGGMPAPDGTADLKLSGANKLIDSLVALGVVPDDQAMMARMMLGMFAKPGSEPDTLTSTIVVTKDGHITANGQQVR